MLTRYRQPIVDIANTQSRSKKETSSKDTLLLFQNEKSDQKGRFNGRGKTISKSENDSY